MGILVSDFDGTITKYDFYDLLCRRFPEVLKLGAWERYEAGEITHFEALRQMFSAIRTDESNLLAIAEDMHIDPRFADSVRALGRAGWSVVIASAGCDWYIHALLKRSGVTVVVHANPGRFVPGQGLSMTLPTGSPFLSEDLGINKYAVVKEALGRSQDVAYAGDGKPDLVPALLVPSQKRFARSWLAKKLQEIGEPYRSFDSWSEIADILVREVS